MSTFRSGSSRRPGIGTLRHRVALQAPVRTGDGGGGAVVTWSTIAEVWAAIRPQGGSEAVFAEAVSGVVTHDITIRHRAGVVPAMRFSWDGRIFEITAVLDIDERRRMLRCLCREQLL